MSITDNLGLDIGKFTKKNPATAKMDEQSEKLKDISRDNIKKIRSPRNQARKVDSTINRASREICDNMGKKLQALLKGQITPKQVIESLGDSISGGLDSLLKDGLGVKDIKDLGKKAAGLGVAILADKAGIDDKLEEMLRKIDQNKRKVNDVGQSKRKEDEVLKKLPPVLRKILKGDKDALANFIEQKCNEAQTNMKNDALGRSGLSGKVREFVKK